MLPRLPIQRHNHRIPHQGLSTTLKQATIHRRPPTALPVLVTVHRAAPTVLQAPSIHPLPTLTHPRLPMERLHPPTVHHLLPMVHHLLPTAPHQQPMEFHPFCPRLVARLHPISHLSSQACPPIRLASMTTTAKLCGLLARAG